ncbi:hypothetical protein COO60DRAFT_553967 [Scenedesmus sp. NREL 46B-D3]|nr:hypothetical protein COO60DRAFT_553967 [Scenedesmus sp. NREL 46B-D3]
MTGRGLAPPLLPLLSVLGPTSIFEVNGLVVVTLLSWPCCSAWCALSPGRECATLSPFTLPFTVYIYPDCDTDRGSAAADFLCLCEGLCWCVAGGCWPCSCGSCILSSLLGVFESVRMCAQSLSCQHLSRGWCAGCCASCVGSASQLRCCTTLVAVASTPAWVSPGCALYSLVLAAVRAAWSDHLLAACVGSCLHQHFTGVCQPSWVTVAMHAMPVAMSVFVLHIGNRARPWNAVRLGNTLQALLLCTCALVGALGKQQTPVHRWGTRTAQERVAPCGVSGCVFLLVLPSLTLNDTMVFDIWQHCSI